MQRVLTAAEMQEADRATIQARGVPGLILMESAASAVTREVLRRCRAPDRERVLVLCGKGNNGGDGLAVARQLLVRAPRLSVRTVLLAEPGSLGPDPAANWTMLAAQDYRADVAPTPQAWRALLPELRRSTLVVDALLGTGLRGPARGLAAEVISDLNRAGDDLQVVSVDLPSGLGSDAGAVLGECVRADCTVTFTAPKVSHVLPPACDRIGALTVSRIGTAEAVLEALPGPRLLLSEAEDAREFVQPRDRSVHKGSCGHVLAVGGSRSKPGAILMAGTAALRGGAGLVTMATAASAGATLLAARPELMLEPAGELADGSLGPDAFDPAWLAGKTVLALGPGLGSSEANCAFVRRACRACEVPLVLDADGLAALRPGAGLEPRRAPTVLTPHPGEMARMLGCKPVEVQSDRLRIARDYALASGAYLVLKGQRTLIADPGGEVIVNPTGTPGLATAGSGDILTGLIAAFLAQFPAREVLRTVAAAVYLHGLAGELACDELGEQGMVATDILRHLPGASRALRG